MELKDSKTKTNLMRAFAGECQARARYNIAAELARKEGHEIIARVFEYTASQEMAHAKVFYDFLKAFNSEVILLDTSYPVNNYDTLKEHLAAAKNNEYEEWDMVYSGFAKVAQEEGFGAIANAFNMISEIEKVHSDRFDKYLKEYNDGILYKEEKEIYWMCANCGAVIKGTEAPPMCPVCQKNTGFFTKNMSETMLFEQK